MAGFFGALGFFGGVIAGHQCREAPAAARAATAPAGRTAAAPRRSPTAPWASRRASSRTSHPPRCDGFTVQPGLDERRLEGQLADEVPLKGARHDRDDDALRAPVARDEEGRSSGVGRAGGNGPEGPRRHVPHGTMTAHGNPEVPMCAFLQRKSSGGAGNRTRVRETSTFITTCVAYGLYSSGASIGRITGRGSRIFLANLPPGEEISQPAQ